MTREQREILEGLVDVRFDEPMSSHTTFGVGGPAEAFVTVKNTGELTAVMRFANERRLSYFFLGGGSNLLVRDGGMRGIVLQLDGDFKKYDVLYEAGHEVYVRAFAAVRTPGLVRWTLEQDFGGLEVMAGVPGVVGGNLLMNAGTRRGCMADVVDEATILDRQLREITLKGKSLRFEYRKLKLPRTAAVLKVVFKLHKFQEGEARPLLGELLKQRREEQPIADQTCGCVFKNPDKVSAGQLIDEAGLRGVRVGGARISTLHGNFIINEGSATARDILVLMGLVKDRVKQSAGVSLENEVIVLGEEKV